MAQLIGGIGLDHVYLALLAAFVTHELDAVRRHEWRVLPLTSFLPDRIGAEAFIWLHVPLFWALLWFDERGGTLRLCVATFAIVHVALHWFYRNHPANEFNNCSSWSLIGLTGALGAIYLLVGLRA
jgi:hypothetical protein